MALNLSTLTSPATSGDVLAEALTTADFLEPVPVLRNLARGSQKGGDAKQGTALNQPKALPLIDGDGYLYLPKISGNEAEVNSVVLPQTSDFDLRVEFIITEAPEANKRFEFFSQYVGGSDGRLIFSITDDLRLRLFWHPHTFITNPNVVTIGQRHVARVTRVSGQNTIYIDDTQLSTFGYSGNILQTNTVIGLGNTDDRRFKGAIFSVTEGSNTNIDFTATNVRHGDTKFKCATGQVVTINQSGNDPATIIKKPVLRFDGVNDGLRGLFANNIDGGYMFAAFTVLGTGGGGNDNRVFSVNANGAGDVASNGFVYGLKYGGSPSLASYGAGAYLWAHNGMYDDDRGDILYEAKAKSGGLITKVNNANKFQPTTTLAIASNEFNVGNGINYDRPAAIDLEYLAVFPATITDDQADSVRNYINNRNNVFSLIDSQGYYFYNAQAAPVGAITTGSASWNGRIVGSDNGDTDKFATQATANDQPVSDGYVVTFADNSDHLDIPSTTQAGWQIVGTSLGTFTYRVDNDAVTELNLLGNAGTVRSIGDLYGIILLPASATGKDIEDARKLLIDRGASDGVSGNTVQQFWQSRNDIVEFKQVDTSSVTSFREGWRFCASLEIFPPLQAPNCTNFLNAWEGNSSLNSFGAIDASSGTTFTSAWKSCASLQQFPSGAKLGTSASSVNFTEAWRESGLTSFNTDLPTGTIFQKTWRQSALTSFGSIDLSSGNSFNSSWQLATSLSSFGAIDARNGTNFQEAWRDCSSLTDFSGDAKLGTSASNVNFTSAWSSSGLTSFSTPLPTATTLVNAFRQCNSLTSFDLDEIPLATNCQTAWALNPALTSFSTKLPKCGFFNAAWYNCSALTDFSADVFSEWNPSSIESLGVFNNAWDGCTSLTAQSVENILTSIDASGHYATTNKLQGGTALADAGIDIDYDGTTLSAATNSAITSLKSKGWSIFINSVEQ